MSRGITVVKVGGNEVDDAAWLARFAASLVLRGGSTVVVHGGGKEITTLQRALGAEPEWRDGLRVTTEASMRAVAMVLSGVVNKRVVSALLSAGTDAIGVSGEDGGLLRAEVLRGGELGRTGEVAQVRTRLLLAWLEQGLLPVVSPVSRGPDGGPLNVNADDAAAAVAAALGATELLLVSNVPGVLRGGEVVRSVAADGVEALVEDGTASAGMAPKLRAAARAAAAGARVRIGGLEMLRDAGAGTRVLRARALAGTA
ncbi:MAG TPA: acetylglutamate kinase [Longimicrobiaceae bacterium]|nr:acetylglutamate kinase [Longimicrobiaceae bacterium]